MILQTRPAAIPPPAYRELTEYLRISGCALSTSEALSHAILDWVAAQRGSAASQRLSMVTLMLAGPGRNAWREFWVRLHGEKQWVAAIKLRRALEQRPVAASPIDAMAAAARTMSNALQTTLTLVQHIHHKATVQPERRLPKHRRLDDSLADD